MSKVNIKIDKALMDRVGALATREGISATSMLHQLLEDRLQTQRASVWPPQLRTKS